MEQTSTRQSTQNRQPDVVAPVNSLPPPTMCSRTDCAINICIASYSLQASEGVMHLLKGCIIDRPLQIRSVDLNRHEAVSADLVFAVYEPSHSLQQFMQDCTAAKKSGMVPQLFAMASEPYARQLHENHEHLFVDDIIRLPIDQEHFEAILFTHIAAHCIACQKKKLSPQESLHTRRLGQILLENRIITDEQLKRALELQIKSHKRLGDTLVELGFINEEQRLHFVARQQGVDFALPRQYAMADLNVVALIPEHIARRHHCCAVEKLDGELIVIMTDTQDLRLLDTLRDLTELRIKPVLGMQEDIDTSVDRFYHAINSHKDATSLMADLGDRVEFIQAAAHDVDAEVDAAESAEVGIVRLVNMLVADAVREHASDIHIEPMENDLIIRYRIDGELRRVMSPPRKSHQAIITRLKILANLDIAERRLPQDGRMMVRIDQRDIDIRLSIIPSILGEKAVMRILDTQASIASIYQLGFNERDLSIFKAQILNPHGIIIITGPTGSGKTTTLYAALQEIRSVTKNIITVEDPVEYHIDQITQIQVNSKIGLTFAAALRSILRQDPDVILIGEIRDQETADIAIKMSLTGHLVLSTLHTNDAASTIARMLDIGVPPLLLGSSINLIAAQRLVRKICPRCRTEYTPPNALVDQLHIPSEVTPHFFRGEGCVACNGIGYSGRTTIVELMPVSRELRSLIMRSAPVTELQSCAEREGMQTLRASGIDLVMNGTTTIEQVIAATMDI